MLKGREWGRKGFGVVFPRKLEVVAILKGKKFPPFKVCVGGGGTILFTLS